MISWKIVADTGCDYLELPNVAENTSFVSVPLTIQIAEQTFVDDQNLNVDQMMEAMYASQETAATACPSPQMFKEAYQGADNVIAITITSGLSGSYNAARVGMEMLLEEQPDVKIHLIDSLSAGGEIDLLVTEINRLIAQGLSFEEVVEGITAYQERTKLLFLLPKVDNLVKNGRVSKLLGRVIGLLNIRMIGEASKEGKLELLHKPRGHKKSVQVMYAEACKQGYQGGRISIAHSNNDKFCQQFSELVRADFPEADITIIPTSGLCSFYAEEGGLLIGYETN